MCKLNLECMELKDIVSNNTLLYLNRNGDYAKQKAILKEANLRRGKRGVNSLSWVPSFDLALKKH